MLDTAPLSFPQTTKKINPTEGMKIWSAAKKLATVPSLSDLWAPSLHWSRAIVLSTFHVVTSEKVLHVPLRYPHHFIAFLSLEAHSMLTLTLNYQKNLPKLRNRPPLCHTLTGLQHPCPFPPSIKTQAVRYLFITLQKPNSVKPRLCSTCPMPYFFFVLVINLLSIARIRSQKGNAKSSDNSQAFHTSGLTRETHILWITRLAKQLLHSPQVVFPISQYTNPCLGWFHPNNISHWRQAWSVTSWAAGATVMLHARVGPGHVHQGENTTWEIQILVL